MTEKNKSLDGLRGVAALSVLFSHMLLSFFPYLGIYLSKNSEIPQQYLWQSYATAPWFQLFYNGSFAVSVFFVLSGYVITRKAFVMDDRLYLYSGALKRYPRLVIPSAASVLIAWALLTLGLMNTDRVLELGGAGWPSADYRQPVTFSHAFWNAWVGAPVLGNNFLNAPLWTINLELLGSLALFSSYILAGPRNTIFAFFFSYLQPFF